MNKINDLIKEMCPNGVEYKLLKDVSEMKRGQSITTKNLKVGKIPVIAGGQEPSFYNDKYNREGETITVSSSGAYAGFLNYWNEPILCTDSFSIKAKKLNMRYLYHYLKMKQNEIYNKKRGAGIPHVHISDLEKFKIPCPPLEVQGEIVRILDKFGELEAELETELETELEKRESQYEFWRGKLFEKENIKYMKISEFAKCYAGATPSTSHSEYWENGTIPWMSSGEVNNIEIYDTEKKITKLGYNSSSTKMLPINTVVVALAGQGKTRGLVAITRKEVCTNQSLCGIVPDERVDNEYLFHYLQSRYKDLRRISSGDGTRGGLNLKMINDYEVPVPDIDEQKKIISVLNRFSRLVNSYTDGLPAEIELRRKQYEYYRNKLLSFEELGVSE